MVPRFVQLFLLASLILLIPSLLYLSHGPTSSYLDPKTGLAYSSDSIRFGTNPLVDSNPLAQTSQGEGVDLQHAEQQGKPKWSSAWTWQDVGNGIKKPVDKIEGTWKSLVDGWKGTSPIEQAATTAHGIAAAAPADAVGPAPKGKQDDERIEGVIMPKMANATAKAALGRSTWHFLHTMTLRFPDKPTPEQRKTLQTFFENFALLYPCGECAKHFQQLIKELPPQTATRMNAALWLCTIHNQVNESLGKPEFPCDKLDESYDCGCGPETPESGTASSVATADKESAAIRKDNVTPFQKRSESSLEDGIKAMARRVFEFALPASAGHERELGTRLERRMLESTEQCLCRLGNS